MAHFDRLTTLLAVGLAAASAIPIAARSWWLAELFSHFRLQYVALLLIAMLVFLLRRRRGAAAALVPFALYTAWVIAASGATSTGLAEGAARITIANANVNSGNSAYGRLVDYIVAESPDLAVLLEIDPGWKAQLTELEELYPHRIERPQEGSFGIALLSRIPLTDASVRDLSGNPAVAATVTVDGRSLRVIGVHLRPPTSSASSATRNAQLEELGAWIENEPAPVVAIGDFNMTLYSPVLTDWLAAHGLTAAAQTGRAPISWPTSLPLLGILIDHYVVSEDLIISEHRRGPSIGSDHYPLMAAITLRGRE